MAARTASTSVSKISRSPEASWGNPEGQVPPALAGIEPYMVAAYVIQARNPRIAYLCEFKSVKCA